MLYSLKDLMELVVSEQGEAIHLHDGEAPVLEVRGKLHRIEGPCLDSGDAQALFQDIAPKEQVQELMRNGLAFFKFRFNENTFFWMMAFREDGQVRIELRKMG
jgi:Tfp pilus assembly pilus retraction ATPase PilT